MGDTKATGSFRAALAHRDFRLVLGGLAVSFVGDWMYGVALLAYVFEETHSPAWVAAAGILRLLPYLLFGTLGGLVADRFERRLVMIVSDGARAVIMFVLAAVAAFSGSVAAAVAIAMVSTTVSTPYQPAVAAMTPALVGEEDLAAANSAMSVIDNVGLALGPAIGGILLVFGSPALAFAFNGATFLVSLACVALVRSRSRAGEAAEEGSLRTRLAAGFEAVRSSADIALMLAVVVASTILYGQENVLLVFVSKHRLGTGGDGVGFLFAAIGVGGLIGAGISNRLARDRRPGRTLAITLVLSGASLIGLSFTSTPLLAYGFMMLDGAGAVILDVLAITMLQRTVSQDVMARVFGILMTLAVAGTLLGTLIAPVVLKLTNLRVALVAAGAMLPALALLGIPRFRALNSAAQAVRAELGPRIEFLGRLAILRAAPQAAIEMLASRLREERAAPGATVVRQGERADDFFVVRSGTLNVLSSGERDGQVRNVNRLGEGDYFGEIGLLERIPRTATVQTTSDCDLYRISGDDFMEAVGQSPALSGALRGGMVGRLARTHPSHGRGDSPAGGNGEPAQP